VNLNTEVTRIHHNDAIIKSIEINGQTRCEVNRLVSTLPLDCFLNRLEPAPPESIIETASRLNYRHVVLVGLFLNKPSVTEAATVYFPDCEFPFTRIYEPRNRCATMSPPGKTSLIAEFPCFDQDPVWIGNGNTLISTMSQLLESIGWIKEQDIIDSCVQRVKNAYPVLEFGYEKISGQLNQYLAQFKNLQITGRNGCFEYLWMHNLLRFGKQILEGDTP